MVVGRVVMSEPLFAGLGLGKSFFRRNVMYCCRCWALMGCWQRVLRVCRQWVGGLCW